MACVSVSVSFSNYRKEHDGSAVGDDDSDDDTDDGEGRSDVMPAAGAMPRKGYKGSGKNITTKHDPQICGRRNASKVMQFPPGFETGNGEDFDMKLSNNVYNVLKVHSYQEEKRGKRHRDKQERAVTELSLDPRTRLILYKLVNSGTLDAVNGCIATGKESTVFHALGGSISGREVPGECAVKVFKTTLNEFKTRERYVEGEHKFAGSVAKHNPRKFVRLWAEKEMHNLNRIRKLGIPCPEVVALKKHVLVMTFLGRDRSPAPQLKDARLTGDQRTDAYHQIIHMMQTLYRGQLVHADLSEYNILWHQGQCHLIDVSQSVSPQQQHAHHFLLRDCTNVYNFFSKGGVSEVMRPPELFNHVTGLHLQGEGEELLAQLQEFEKDKELVTHGLTRTGKDYNFDYFFEKSISERTQPQQDQSDSSSDEEEVDVATVQE